MQNIGILDPNGYNNNPLTNKPYSDLYKELAQKWSNYPAYTKAHEIIDTIRSHQVILIEADTGSGKTVLIPKFALHSLDYNGKIVVTLPKQIATYSAAEYSAKTLDVVLGEEVGFQYKNNRLKSRDTKLLYATDGTIVMKLIHDPSLHDIDIVIIDEAHERKVQIDFLLYLLKQTLQIRPNFKVIIMSATIDAELFARYYSEFNFARIHIPGRTFPIKHVFYDKPKDYLKFGLDLIKQLQNEKGDIIFFVPKTSDAIKICDLLKDSVCIEVFSGMNKDKEYTLANPHTGQHIIITTPVAESSITINGIEHVIDSGYEMASSFDTNHNAKKLEQSMITSAQVQQRCGRTGRTSPGTCYHLYPQSEYDSLIKYPEPQIRKSNLYDIFLKLLVNIKYVKDLIDILTKFIEPPNSDSIKQSLSLLFELGLINETKITSIGKQVANMGHDPMISLALVYGKDKGCFDQVARICGVLMVIKNNLSSLFLPKTLEKDIGKKINKFYDKTGDHISILNIINSYEKNNNKKWCDKYRLDKHKLDKCLYMYNKLISSDSSDKSSNHSSNKSNNMADILLCFSESHKTNRGELNNNTYKTQTGKYAKLGKFCFLKRNPPRNVFYTELFISTNPEINIVSRLL